MKTSRVFFTINLFLSTVLVFLNHIPTSKFSNPYLVASTVALIPTPLPPIVTLYGHIEYIAKIRDAASVLPSPFPSPLPLPRVWIEVWDDMGMQPLGITWTNSNGDYSITVPNNESDGIDPKLIIYADDYNNSSSTRVMVVKPNGESYAAETAVIGNNFGGTYNFDYVINEPTYANDIVQAFLIVDLMANTAYNKMQAWVTWNNTDPVKVSWPEKCIGLPNWLNPTSCYFYDAIYIDPFSGDIPDTILHEYGHFVLSRKIGNDAIVHACALQGYYHQIWEELDPQCAWSEGWADFFQMAVQGDGDYIGSKLEEIDRQLPRVVGNPESYEGIVAATLWDFFDGANEPHDEFADGFNGTSSNGIWYSYPEKFFSRG